MWSGLKRTSQEEGLAPPFKILVTIVSLSKRSLNRDSTRSALRRASSKARPRCRVLLLHSIYLSHLQKGDRRTHRPARRPSVDAEEMSATRLLRSRGFKRRRVLHSVALLYEARHHAVSLRDESRTWLP